MSSNQDEGASKRKKAPRREISWDWEHDDLAVHIAHKREVPRGVTGLMELLLEQERDRLLELEALSEREKLALQMKDVTRAARKVKDTFSEKSRKKN